VRVLGLYAVSPDTAFAFAVAIHVFTTVATIALGLGGMLFMRISFQEVFAFRGATVQKKARAEQARELPPVPTSFP